MHDDLGCQPDAAEAGAVRQPRHQAARDVSRRGRLDRGAGDHGRDEGSRGQRAAQFFDDDDQLGQPEPGSAERLGQMEAQPAQFDEVVPEFRQLLGFGLEQGAGGPPGFVPGQEVGRRLGEGTVVFGDRDRHGGTIPST